MKLEIDSVSRPYPAYVPNRYLLESSSVRITLSFIVLDEVCECSFAPAEVQNAGDEQHERTDRRDDQEY